MGTYKNSYTVNEDEVLWELHEIRHKLHEEQKNVPLAERNKVARDFFEAWKLEHQKSWQNPLQVKK